MEATPTRKTYRAGAVCPTHGFVHSRPKASERPALRVKVAALTGGRCIYCGCNVGTGSDCELDRAVGSCAYVACNLLPACKACNNARNRAEATSITYGAHDVPALYGALATLASLAETSRSTYAQDIRAALLEMVPAS